MKLFPEPGVLTAQVLKRVGSQLAPVFLVLTVIAANGAEKDLATTGSRTTPNISLRNEVQHAIDKGLGWLEKNQDTNGFWSTAELPAITALGAAAFRLQPGAREQAIQSAAVKKAYGY